MKNSERSSAHPLSNAQRIFQSADETCKELIRSISSEERDVMHLKRRSDIHQRIYEHVKRVIK